MCVCVVVWKNLSRFNDIILTQQHFIGSFLFLYARFFYFIIYIHRGSHVNKIELWQHFILCYCYYPSLIWVWILLLSFSQMKYYNIRGCLLVEFVPTNFRTRFLIPNLCLNLFMISISETLDSFSLSPFDAISKVQGLVFFIGCSLRTLLFACSILLMRFDTCCCCCDSFTNSWLKHVKVEWLWCWYLCMFSFEMSFVPFFSNNLHILQSSWWISSIWNCNFIFRL